MPLQKYKKATKFPNTDLRRNQPCRRTVARLVQSFLRKHPREQRGCVPRNQGLRNPHRPERAGIVKLYKGQLPIYDNFGITKQIKSSFGKTISYKSGAYLIIEHTEALHVVDVNSGNRIKNANGQEANALEVNLGAADDWRANCG